jgi:transcriptional regulator with XRE-family HTH domain
MVHVTVNPWLTSAYCDPVARAEGGKRFGALLKKHREALSRREGRDIRQEDVAERAGISESTYGRWERGDVINPKPEEVRSVCRVLRLPPIKAAIALGYVDTDEQHEPEPPRTFTPTLEEIIEMFEDDDIPDDTKLMGVEYLRYLRSRTRKPKSDDGQAEAG